MMDNELRCLKDKQKTEEVGGVNGCGLCNLGRPYPVPPASSQVVFPKKKGSPLGMMLIESGFGSPIPCCIIAALSRSGAAHQSGLLNVGDHVLALNGVTFVGLPLKSCLWHVQASSRAHCSLPWPQPHSPPLPSPSHCSGPSSWRW